MAALTPQAVKPQRRRPWNGLIVPDHEGHDALMDDLACPDLYGLEDSGRYLFRKTSRSPSAAARTDKPDDTHSSPHVSSGPVPS